MASAIYPAFATAAYTKKIDWVNDSVSGYLMDTADYTYSAAHTVLADLTVAGREEVVALTGKSVTAGVLDGGNSTWPTATGDGIEAIVVVDTTFDCLCLYYDLGATTLLNGGDIVATWAGAPNYMAKMY